MGGFACEGFGGESIPRSRSLGSTPPTPNNTPSPFSDAPFNLDVREVTCPINDRSPNASVPTRRASALGRDFKNSCSDGAFVGTYLRRLKRNNAGRAFHAPVFDIPPVFSARTSFV